MKKLIILFFISLVSVITFAQTPGGASHSYQTFQKLSAAGAPENELYGALYQCYQDNMAAVTTVSSSDPRHEYAKEALVNTWPYLRNAATYYDQKGIRKKALQFSQAYVDLPLAEELRGEHFIKDEFYPTMVFYAASNTFNVGDYKRAVKYFKEYISTGEQKHLYNVRKYMAVACINIKDYVQAERVLADAVAANPTDYDLLSMAVNVSIENKDNRQLQKYVSKALTVRPNDQKLQSLQGQLYEDSGNYSDALKIYQSLFSKNPTSLTYAKHIALNNYNLGVLFTNKASLESDRRIATQYDNQALSYFEAAIPTMRDILNAEPTSLQYHEALAVAYQMTGRKSEFAIENQKISSLGGQTLSSESVPSLMTFTSSKPSSGQSSQVAVENTSGSTPLYSEYAKKYVEESIAKWQAKDPYETIDEYKSRVTTKTRDARIKELLKEAEGNYIGLYARDVVISDFRLCPYDAEHEVFLAESDYGDVLIPVPRANNEARIFESSWNGTQCLNPRFTIDNDRIVLCGLTFVTPMGQSYRFDDNGAMNYTQTEVDIQFADIDYDVLGDSRYDRKKSSVKKEKVTIGVSDVDKNIPVSKINNDRTFAVVIANEDYEMVAGVPMALNDGRVFSQYCQKTLGLPENNVRLYENATYGTMLHALYDIKSIASAYNGDINIIFYYAGHGFPDERTKDAYLLPVDGDGIHTDVSYSLDKLYSELSGLKTKSVCVFLDACFSGSNRDGSMLASARGVALKPKPSAPQGNMIVFSAASGDETAFPYEEKGHGLFTYFLLKKLQESKGNATLEEICNYVTEKVRQQSVVVNRKSQTPHLNPSYSLSESWKKIRLIP